MWITIFIFIINFAELYTTLLEISMKYDFCYYIWWTVYNLFRIKMWVSIFFIIFDELYAALFSISENDYFSLCY